MIKASLVLLVVGLVAVSAFNPRGSASGAGRGSGGGSGGFGGKLGGTGTIDTGASVEGTAKLGHGSMFGGLFDFSDAEVSGAAEGSLKADGTFSAGGGAYGAGQVRGEGSGSAGARLF